jgi:hypothetical protein
MAEPYSEPAFTEAELAQWLAGTLKSLRADSYSALGNTVRRLHAERDEARRAARVLVLPALRLKQLRRMVGAKRGDQPLTVDESAAVDAALAYTEVPHG